MKKVAGVGGFKAMARSSRTVDHQDVCKARCDLKSMELLEAQNEKSTAGPRLKWEPEISLHFVYIESNQPCMRPVLG